MHLRSAVYVDVLDEVLDGVLVDYLDLNVGEFAFPTYYHT